MKDSPNENTENNQKPTNSDNQNSNEGSLFIERSSNPPFHIDLFKKHSSSVVAPSGKGRSFMADFLRDQNPNATIIEIELPQDISEMAPEQISYSKMNKELTPDIIAECIEVITAHTDIIIPEDQFIQLIDKDPVLCFSIVLNGPNDTEVRSDLANALSLSLINKSWPQYRDKVDFELFCKELEQAALAKGFSLVKD